MVYVYIKPEIILVEVQTPTDKYYFDFTVYRIHEHLGLEYLQSSLEKAGYVVKNLDGPSMQITENRMLREIVGIKPKLIGITVDNHSLNSSMILANKIKQRLKDTHITVGGHLPTCAAEEILNDFDCIDSVVLGYGEETIVELAESISKGLPLDGVTGIFFRNGTQIIRNPPRSQPLNINNIPFPARDVLKYRQSQNYPPAARMITSRGCPFNCSYCSTPPFLSFQMCKKWRARSPENVVDEISKLVNTFGIRVIVFCDDNFIGPNGKERAEEIARLIIKRELNIHFWIMCRVDSFRDKDDNFIRFLKKAGLWGVFLGIESCAALQLTAYHKFTTVEKNESIVNLFKRHNIVVECGFIMFHPYVTFHELLENAKGLYQIGELSIFTYFTNRLELYPGVGFIEDLKQRDLLAKDYQYNSLYGYRFLDPKIEHFAIALEKIADEVRSIDEIVWNLKRLSQIISLFIDECQNNLSMNEIAEKLFQIKKGIDNTESDVGEINYQMFLKYVEIAYEEEESKYDSMKDRHKDQLTGVIKRSIRYIKNLRDLESELKQLKDGDILNWFFTSPIYERIMLHLLKSQKG